MATLQSELLSGRGTQTRAAKGIPSALYRGRLRTRGTSIPLATTDIEVGDVVVLCPLPSAAVVHAIFMATDTVLGAAITHDLGLYQDPEGLVPLDQGVFAKDSVTFQTTSLTTFADEAFQRLQWGETGLFLWQLLGLPSDPNTNFYLAITFTAAGDTAGTIGFSVRYAVD